MGCVIGQGQGAWTGSFLWSQDGYRAQVPQHPIDTYRHISHILNTSNITFPLVGLLVGLLGPGFFSTSFAFSRSLN